SKEISALVRQSDTHVSVETGSLSLQMERWLGSARVAAELSAALGMLALLLASVGVYGVISYSVEQRRRELGVRMALGARPGEIVRFILRDNMRSIAHGLGLGLVSSIGAARSLRAFLYGRPSAE